MQNFEGVK